MAIITSRTTEAAQIHSNQDICTGCGLCVQVCKDFSLEIVNGKVSQSTTPVFGCIGCGHCMAICPENAIKITGRDISPDDLLETTSDEVISYKALLNMFQKRRSIREFKDKAIPTEVLDKIINAASTAPMGLPPSDVNLLVFQSKTQLNNFAADFANYLKSMKWIVSNLFLGIMRPFWGKTNHDLFRGFVKPLIHTFTTTNIHDFNPITYNAPAAIYFYASPWADPADPIVAATTAMYAAEALGLGSCMIGSIHPLIQNGSKAASFRKRHGIRYKSREGVFLLLGYPAVKYRKSIQRRFSSVDFKTNNN